MDDKNRLTKEEFEPLEELERIPDDATLKEMFYFSPEFEQFMDDLLNEKKAAQGAASEDESGK